MNDIYIDPYIFNLSAVPILKAANFATYSNIHIYNSNIDTGYVISWGDAIHKHRCGIMETGFLWDAVHIDTIGLYHNCSLNFPEAIKRINSFRAPKSAQDIVFSSGLPFSKYKQPANNITWDGVVLALQNPSDRSIHRGSSTEDYYKFVEGACKKYHKHLYLKLHPWNKGDIEKRFIEIANNYGCTIGRVGHSIIKKCKFVLTYNSTFCVDAFMREIPVVQYAPGYFWQTGAVTYSHMTFPDDCQNTINNGLQLCDFMIWKYMIYQKIDHSKWVMLFESFANSNELFPLNEEFSYANNVNFKCERNKYINLYREQKILKTNRGYGHTNHSRFFPNLNNLIKKVSPDLVIDCGCGHGEFCRKIHDVYNIPTIGIDFALYNKIDSKSIPIVGMLYTNGDCTDEIWWDYLVSLINAKYNNILITAFDFLEHISEDNIDIVLKNWLKLTNNICGTIGLANAKCRYVNGEQTNLHLTVNDMKWWENKISSYFDKVIVTNTTRKKKECSFASVDI